MVPPQSRIGAISSQEKATIMKHSPFNGVYDTPLDRESAYEILGKKMEDNTKQAPEQKSKGRPKQSIAQTMMNSAARSFGTQIGRQIIRGILGSIMGKK